MKSVKSIYSILSEKLGMNNIPTKTNNAAFKKIGKSYIPFYFEGSNTQSSEELILKIRMLSSSVDVLLSSYYDSDTFSEGS